MLGFQRRALGAGADRPLGGGGASRTGAGWLEAGTGRENDMAKTGQQSHKARGFQTISFITVPCPLLQIKANWGRKGNVYQEQNQGLRDNCRGLQMHGHSQLLFKLRHA